ncbi:MAG: hypothetical protein IJY12_05575 [Clostridia bacterium]|nr:hypothetical protein [Clostridia bacterium]
MNENAKFSYTYSASVNKEVQAIRQKYLPREENKLQTLKRLDQKVQTAGMCESLVVGILGFLLFGLGVCMAIRVIGGGIFLGVLLGLIGTAAIAAAYPVYRACLNKTKEKLVPQILALVSELEKSL